MIKNVKTLRDEAVLEAASSALAPRAMAKQCDTCADTDC